MSESEGDKALLPEASSLKRQSHLEPALMISELLLTRLPAAERLWVQIAHVTSESGVGTGDAATKEHPPSLNTPSGSVFTRGFWLGVNNRLFPAAVSSTEM
jgi:hypothetical protein